MALEEQLAILNANVEKQNDLLAQLLSKTSAAPAAGAAADKPASEDKPKTTTKKADKPKADDKPAEPKGDTEETVEVVTIQSLDAKIRPWLGEFDKDHPETVGRKAKFKERLGKLGAEKLSTIADQEKLNKLNEWFDKIKVHDFGFGAGRVAADPDTSEEGGDQDDL